MILTRSKILARIASGHIVAPSELVQINSVNVRLGADMWVASDPGQVIDLHEQREFSRVAGTGGRFTLHPGRVYIGTTLDEYGSRLKGDGLVFVPEMRARSTTGRHGLTVALCAGFGDAGYCGRWALEIINNNLKPVSICIGTEIGQVVFHEASGLLGNSDGYGGPDNYQKDDGSIQFLPKPFKTPNIG